jgi:hypothetical protein
VNVGDVPRIVAAAAAAVLLALAQDASASAPAGRFTVTADVVLDTMTGLTWQRATAPGTYTYVNASTYCQDLTLGGLTDWRLPTIRELRTIVDRRRHDPAIDEAVFPGTLYTGSSYWSSTRHATAPSMYAWVMNFAWGSTSFDEYSPGPSNWVRCVR